MPRMLRGDLPDGIYHVTTRGVHAALVFRDDDDRRTFLRLLARTADGQRWRCHAFCLMGTHYHLIVETTRERLSAGMQQLNGVYAQLFNRRHGRPATCSASASPPGSSATSGTSQPPRRMSSRTR